MGRQGGQGEGQEMEVPTLHRALGEGTPGRQGQPPTQYQGTWSLCRKIGEGGTALPDGQQAVEQPFLQRLSPPGRPFPSLGWGVRGSTPGMGCLAGAEGQGGWREGVLGTGWHPRHPRPAASGAQ